jgi:hypothetical protein
VSDSLKSRLSQRIKQRLCRVGKLCKSLALLYFRKLRCFKQLSKKHQKIVISGFAVVGVILAVLSGVHVLSATQSEAGHLNAAIYYQAKKSAKDLDALSDQVTRITEQLSSKRSVVDMDAIKQSLIQVTIQIKSISDENAESLRQFIQDENIVVNKKLDSLQLGVNSLQENMHKVTYVDEKELPFTVESVDLIQQQAVVTVRYDYKSQPLDVGYSMAGWELIKADFSKQTAEFINKKDQHILVHLIHGGSA